MDHLTFIEVDDDYWLRTDQIASVQPRPMGNSGHVGARIYQIGTGYIDSGLTVSEVMERIAGAAKGHSDDNF